MMPVVSMIGAALIIGLLVWGVPGSAQAQQIADARQQDCAPANGLEFLCGLRNVEDMVRIPGRDALIGSGGLSPDAPTGPGASAGELYFIDASARTHARLVPDMSGKPQREYGTCPGAPDLSRFAPHGIAIRPGAQDHHQLYVVNHGGREAIEMFAVTVGRASLGLKWIGCVILPDGASGNGVVPLEDGGFVTTKFVDTRRGDMLEQLSTLEKNGAVYRWRPGKGFAELPGGVMAGNNGAETSADGKWLFVNVWPEQRIVRFSLDGAVEPTSIPVDFMPDNIHRMADGSLLIAGQDGDIHSVTRRFKAGEPVDWAVARLDPQSLRLSPLWRGQGTPAFHGVSAAVQVGNALWLGPVLGDRVAIKSLP